MAVGAAALAFAVPAAQAADVVPAPFTEKIAQQRLIWKEAVTPKLTSSMLQAYVDRQQKLKSFDGFEVEATPRLTEDVLLGYIAKRNNRALDAIDHVADPDRPALTADLLENYASDAYVPTSRRVKLADDEKLCLTQAIYHEARGEPREGQLAVANVIINRAMSGGKYPSTICGVVFQNADKGKYKCQFTFACDGRSDLMGRERGAWQRSMKMAETAFYGFQRGQRPDVLPEDAMYYHTKAVAPKWSNTFRRVAAIGAHVFYEPN